MIEFALEKYPVRQTLTTGVQMLLRPLQPDDTSAFTRFHDAIPKGERFLIKHRVNGVGEIDSWCHDLNYDKRLTLVAIADGGVVGYASLNQRPGGWKRHIGMVDALIHPEYRGAGVLRALLNGLVEAAQHAGLTRLEAEFNGERKNTVQSFKKCGFDVLLHLPDYLSDMEGEPHDYVLMGMNLALAIEDMGAGD